LELLTSLKITHIVNVAANIENFFPDKFKYLKVQLLDIPETDLLSALPQCFEFIRQALDSEHSRVLVHCNAGVSRSAAVCVGYVMCFGGKSLNAALAEVKQARPSARPNDGFMEQLKNYEKTLKG
jgi:atypical dual specificity phosphatase